MEPQLPTVGWDIFELVTPRGSAPYWSPRGGQVSSEPPDAESMKQAALQSSGKLVAVRYRIEPETRVDVEFEADELPDVLEEAADVATKAPVDERQGSLFAKVAGT